MAAKQLASAIASSDRHCSHGRANDFLGVQAPSNGLSLEGHWASAHPSGSSSSQRSQSRCHRTGGLHRLQPVLIIVF